MGQATSDEQLSLRRVTMGTARGREETGIQEVREALRGMRYGEVTVVVQDGVIIQVERLEKRRIRTRHVSYRDES